MKAKRTTICRWAGVALSLAFIISGRIAAADKDLFKESRAHWAFQPVALPEVPATKTSARVRNPVDAFIFAELAARNIVPGQPAGKATLLRRASLDLIGLPPTPEEIDDFLADNSPAAFEKVVNRLLDSPHYGERWARHWLDLARYAESEGFKADETRPNAWRYRDYVIHSLNADKPYDRFLKEQIAGDELWPDDPDAQIATAFNRHYPDESNARNLRQRRQEILNDITDTVGGVFLGLTYACARCHDHKFDPILQTDYYRLQAFFANTAAKDDVLLAPAAEVKRHRERLALWEQKTKEIRAEMAAIEEPHRKAIVKDYVEKYPAEIQAILNKPEGERNPFERQMAWKARQYLDPNSHEYIANTGIVAGRLKGDAKKRWQELKKQLDEFADLHPGPLPMGSAMRDIGSEAPGTFLLFKGSFEKPQEEVEPGLLQILYRAPAEIGKPAIPGTTGRRTALASLLIDPRNPLTARVIVNRVWQYHFGRGIVSTPSDFGLKGERPTHPALLDWLSSQFVGHGWSLKYLHRLIMTSATYQQSSAYREAAAAVDEANRFLWRFPRQRLEGEIIRDSALAVAGLLNTKMGGPSVFPELPTGMPTPRGGWKVNDEASDRNERSVYVFVRRNTRYPIFDSFDMPDPHESCPRRNITTSPLQALTLLNSKLTFEWAQSFAGRVLDVAGADPKKQVAVAFRFAFGRLPDKVERQMAAAFLQSHELIVARRERSGQTLALPPGLSGSIAPAQAATLVDFCHMLINANEFVYVN